MRSLSGNDKLKRFTFLIVLMMMVRIVAHSQNSMLVNFGGNTCSATYLPSFSMIKDPLTASPLLLSNCDMQSQLPNYFSVFIAYNPKNNLIYIADIRSGTETKIWVLDAGLPSAIGCPVSIPVTPTYTYSYVSNNFEFDNNGDLWSFSNYDINTGRCSLDKFDVNNGIVINSRVLQFPAGNFPTTIFSGDLCILPNGRMFATLGSAPSQLYEITNYTGSDTATATFLTYIPRDCYGIAYLNGKLEIAGNDFNQSCYYYDYDISSGVLGTEKPFQVNNAPIDNTSFTPSVGCTKQLLGASEVNNNTYDLSYELYVQNMGNVYLTNISVTDDLSQTFGPGNVSNVTTSFAPGFNNAGLSLNTSYNGVSDTKLLASGQNLPNKVGASDNYYFKIIVNCRVTNLVRGITYLNSAISKGEIGSSAAASLVVVTDTSNNGNSSATDPNQNGNANEATENIPTPFSIELLPVKFIDVSARYFHGTDAMVSWKIATPATGGHHFTVEFSTNGNTWKEAGTVMMPDPQQSDYDFIHTNVPDGNLLYRIKETDLDGHVMYSKVVMLRKTTVENDWLVFPVPADNEVNILNSGTTAVNPVAELFDVSGRKLLARKLVGGINTMNTSRLPAGTYYLRINDSRNTAVRKLIVQHP